MDEKRELADEMLLLIETTTSLEMARLQNRQAVLSEYSFRLIWITLAGMVAGALLILVVGVKQVNALDRSLSNINKVAAALAAGEINQHLETEGSDELKELSRSLNRLMENLMRADREITREVEDRMYAEKKALEAAKAKSAFLAHMSHEFRTPLNGILGYAQVLLLDKGLSERNYTVVNSLKRSGENLLELINDVLDLTKIEARSMKLMQSRFYLGDLVTSLKDSYADQMSLKGMEFKLHLDPDLPDDILGDQVRLRQILTNLIGNAVKFTDQGFVELRVTNEENGVRFEVKDTGIGIAPGDHEKVFQAFTQVDHGTKRSNKGTGLGLSISGRLLEMMKSELHLESEPGKGSTFWFILPQPRREGRRLVLPSQNITGYKGERRKIMMVDPGRESAGTLVPLLKNVGFEVFEPQNATQSLADFLRILPDIVILEMNLPEMSGVQAMTRMMEQSERDGRPVPPFFLLSAFDRPEEKDKGLAAGAAEVVGKPLRFFSVMELFHKHMGLEWITGGSRETPDPADPQSPAEDISVPPEPMLRQLLSLARAGNIRRVKEQTETLLQQNSEWETFGQHILKMTGNYQVNALVEWLQQRLNAAQETGVAHAE